MLISSLPNVALSFFFVNIYFYFFHIFIFSTFYKQNNSLRKPPGAHSILLLIFSIRYDSETVSDDYLAYLQSKGISYLFCGKETFDPVILMEKAYTRFGIRKAILSGGAYADWTMLASGLIDEIQTMYLPVIDGDPHSHTLFRRMDGMESAPVALKLDHVEVVAGDGLLVTYRPKNARRNDDENWNGADSAESL